MNVPLLDLKAQYDSIREEVDRTVMEVVRGQRFIMGPYVEALEEQVAAYSGARWGIGVSSGSDALLVSLMAAGVTQGDFVITTPYTFFATAGAIARLGATPVFADIDPATYNMDPDRLEDAAAGFPEGRLKAIIPVHLFGQCCDMEAVARTAGRYGAAVIEDAAQAIGARDALGRPAGSASGACCLSFFPSKNLGCFGDGGMVVTSDMGMREKVAMLRSHGSRPKYYHRYIGGNFRLDALQAAVLLVKLKHLDGWSGRRRENAARYDALFSGSGLPVALPHTAPGNTHVYNQYVIRVKERDALLSHLKANGVGAEVYYPLPLHLQECFGYLGYREGDFPESEAAARETLALPVYPELTGEMAEYVVGCIAKFYGGRADA